MFTGIITDIGEITQIERKDGGDTRFVITTSYDMDEVALGASISCSGACLTVTEKGKEWFAVDVSAESLARTHLGAWQQGKKINLERSLKLGDEMGGHNVLGHVDGVAEVKAIEQVDGSWTFTFIAVHRLIQFIAEKGSVTIDGVSLTINNVDDHSFNVMIIPHTFAHTTFQFLEVGQEVNVEIDIIARYTARLLETQQ